MNTEQEILYSIALQQVNVNRTDMHRLIDEAGSATAIMEHRNCLKDIVPDVNDNMTHALADMDSYLQRAEQEIAFMQKKNARCLAYTNSDFPERLRHIPDAPIALFYCGNANLNASKVISIVGTRKSTPYGQDICRGLTQLLQANCPDVLVISGLAYGTDINAHRGAMDYGLATVGVVAHGLDTIYPASHRNYAAQMATGNGGVLTEYLSHTVIDRSFFLRRNRIVAGLCDACVIVESAVHGGSLSTARLATEYNRNVYAYPGRITDEYSVGCNDLINHGLAVPVCRHEDILTSENWLNTATSAKSSTPKAIQKELFTELTPDEQSIVNCLKTADSMSLNNIISMSGLSYKIVSSLLFGLEMSGIVGNVNGSNFRLIAR